MAADDNRKPLLKRALRPLIPQRLLAERAVIHRLGPRAGRTYLKLRLLDAAGISASNRHRVHQHARSFLFICYGNIMRSPMAELMFKRTIKQLGIEGVQVNSAGLHASPGTEAHPRAQIAASELGLPLEGHRSQLLTAAMAEEADAIFAMDFQNKAELLSLFPQAERKIFMLGTYATEPGQGCEIPDPFFGDQDEARRCYRVLQACIDNLAKSLRTHPQNAGEAPSPQVVSTQV